MQRQSFSSEYHRDAAARFRLLADIEPFPNRRRQFKGLAAEHEELAVGVEETEGGQQARCVGSVFCWPETDRRAPSFAARRRPLAAERDLSARRG